VEGFNLVGSDLITISNSFIFKKSHLLNFFLSIKSFLPFFYINFISQYLVDFELIFIIYFDLFFMRSL